MKTSETLGFAHVLRGGFLISTSRQSHGCEVSSQ